MHRILAILILSCWSVSGWSDVIETSVGKIQFNQVVKGLDTPWAIGILPDNSFIVTERDGELLYVAEGEAKRVKGVPRVVANGQGGLLDVTIARNFSQTRELFLTFSKPQRGGAGTAVAVARFSESGDRLTNLRIIFEAVPGGSGGRHFGSRVVEAEDGSLFVTIGDRDLNSTVSRIPENVGQVFVQSAAEEIIHHRDSALRHVETLGGLALDVTTQTLAPRLLSTYLKVKERGMI